MFALVRKFPLAILAVGFVMTTGARCYGQTKPAADPTDPLAKAAPAVEVPKLFLEVMGPFITLEGTDKEFPLPQDPKVIQKVRAARHAHLRETILDRFDKEGNTKAAWAGQVWAALAAYCLAFTRTAAPREGVYYQAFQKALNDIDPACDDPLVTYFRLRHVRADGFTKFHEVPLQGRAAERLIASNSYPILALHAAHNYRGAAQSLRTLPGSTVTKADVADGQAKFERALRAAVPAATKPDWEDLYELSTLEIEHRMNAAPDRLAEWKVVDRRLADLKAPAWVRDTAEGKALILAAWDARGGGSGASVPADAYALFTKRLRAAKAKLEAAWKAHPDLPQAPTNMLYVAKGLGFGRAEMELWFRRAMEADPDNLEACEAKKEWLQPKWHGTNEDVLAFISQCLRSGNFFGKLPNVAEVPQLSGLPHHEEKALFEYVKRDETWVPFHVVAEAHLARYPDDLWARSRYAYHAGLWKKWAIAHEQFERLGDEPWPGWFPHEGEFADIKRIAKEQAGMK